MVIVYWIRRGEHNDPYTQGYVGVTTNLTNRLQEHKKQKWFCKEPHVIDILQTFEEQDKAYLYEEKLRQVTNIGWNINKGGLRPPVNNRKGIPLPQWSEEQKEKHSLRMKECYSLGIKQHWSTLYTPAEVSQKISQGDPGKSRRGKPALNKTKIREVLSGEVFESQTEAAYKLNLRQGDVSNCLKGRQKSTRGFIFEYAN